MLVRSLFLLLMLGVASIPCLPQSVISAFSGLILYAEGSVFVDGAPLVLNPGRFSELKEGSKLTTDSGKVELLLMPDVILCLGENSAVRMVQNSLADPQIAFLKGSAIVESTDVDEDRSATLLFDRWSVRLPGAGSYRIDATPAQLHVARGEAEVADNRDKTTVTQAELLSFATGQVSARVAEFSDSLAAWSRQRSKIDRLAAAHKELGSEPNQGSKKARSRLFPRMRPQMPIRTW